MADPAKKDPQQTSSTQTPARKPELRKADEDPVGKVYDSRLMRRLGRYLLPYWWQACVSAVAVSLKSLSDVAGPFLVMIGIDRYFPSGEARRTPQPLPRTDSAQQPGSPTASAPILRAASPNSRPSTSRCKSPRTSSNSSRPT